MDFFFAVPLGDLLLFAAFLAALGVVAGFLAGLLGVGGGIVLVPGLSFIFAMMSERLGLEGVDLMHLSVGTSLAVIVPTGLSSALAHYRRGAVDFTLVGGIGAGVLVGVAIATFIARDLSGDTMKMIFATAIVGLAGIMLINPARFKLAEAMPGRPMQALAGLVIGGLSSLIGIGGATLSVPYMSLHNTPMHRAVGTASALGLVIAVPAAIGFMIIGRGADHLPPFSVGYVNFLAWVCIIPISVSIAPLGVRVAHKVSVSKLRKVFAVFMILVALNMWRKILF
ncbi:MAG: sulfite exporter TauE/SafE family protein [Alphaproteobacteria bacterium]|nr:sulfite exporter TauE/SafE family protein [Alphaproteobacteria bacterium]